jgi:hypothetical protein
MVLIRYPNGQTLQGVILALGDQKVRVAIKDSDDVAEYRLISQRWVSEDCEVVAFEFPKPGVVASRHEDPLDALLRQAFDAPVVSRVM